MPRKGPAPPPSTRDGPVVTTRRSSASWSTRSCCAAAVDRREHVYGASRAAATRAYDPVVTLKRALDKRQAGHRGQEPPRRWRDLPGPGRGQARAEHDPGVALGWSATSGSGARRR